MKIATLLFFSLYSLRLRAPRFLGPPNTLLCVLIHDIKVFLKLCVGKIKGKSVLNAMKHIFQASSALLTTKSALTVQ